MLPALIIFLLTYLLMLALPQYRPFAALGGAALFLALGASRKRLKRELRRDLAGIFLGSCATGVILGTPLAWGLWQGFQALVVDTKEMPLTFKHLHPGLRCLCN